MGVKHTTNYATAIALLLIFAMHATADDVEAQTLTIQDSSLWNIEVIDESTSSPNGNLTISDGDYVRISLEVLNSADYSVNGTWGLKFLSGDMWQSSLTQNGTWLPNETKTPEITIGPMSEGIVMVIFEVKINNSSINISTGKEIRVSPNPVIFSSAGDSIIAITGQPAYVGDKLTASILVKNEGQKEGTVFLRLSHNESSLSYIG